MSGEFKLPSPTFVGAKREMKDFGSWTQTSVTQTKDLLGFRPKRQ
jgi:hypothetical protein